MTEKYNEYSLEAPMEEELIKKIASGDVEALHKLYSLVNEGVYAFALSILKNPYEAEDVLQDVFLTIYNKAKTYKGMNKPLAWIYTITKNCCFMKMRKTKKIVKIPVEDISDDAFFSKVENVEDGIVLRAALKSLSSEESQIVMLHIVGGLKNKDIAELLNIPLNTVLSKYNRALVKLRNYIEGSNKNG